MPGLAKGEKVEVDTDKIDKAKKAAASRAKGGNKDKKQTFQYVLWVGGSIGLIVVACLIMIIHPDRGPGQTPVNDVGLISHVNRNAKTWSASPAQMFEGWTINDAKNFQGVAVSNSGGAVSTCQVPDTPVPDNFDLRTKFPQCFSSPIYSMENCTASWAIAAASALSNRFCISDPSEYGDTMLSPQQLLSCDMGSRGCAGGDLDTVWNYIEQSGLVSEVCFPYQADGSVSCDSKCNNEVPLKASSHCVLNNEAAIRREIFLHGPVVAPLFLMNDFLVYRGGLYQPMGTASPLSDERRNRIIHAVKIIGWGVQDRKKYWLIENSWGADWGEQGYAKVLAGLDPEKKDGMVVENYVLAGTPMNKKVEDADDADADFEAEDEQMEDIELPDSGDL
mmetsp:Transcript_19072/g.44570  ORF Transcript_19072/g.44570 Transcript_19072/m.44570 type:complete len:392 (+) Transcript_19072:106-1281(+)